MGGLSSSSAKGASASGTSACSGVAGRAPDSKRESMVLVAPIGGCCPSTMVRASRDTCSGAEASAKTVDAHVLQLHVLAVVGRNLGKIPVLL